MISTKDIEKLRPVIMGEVRVGMVVVDRSKVLWAQAELARYKRPRHRDLETWVVERWAHHQVADPQDRWAPEHRWDYVLRSTDDGRTVNSFAAGRIDGIFAGMALDAP